MIHTSIHSPIGWAVMMDAAMGQGLVLYEPKSFLFPSNYQLSLVHQTSETGFVTLLVGLGLALFGLPLRRLTSTGMMAAFGFTLGGMFAMWQHASFSIFGLGGLAFGAALGAWQPRAGISMVTSAALALSFRAAAMAFVGVEYALPALGIGLFIALALGTLAYRFWTTTSTSLLGATIAVLSLAPVLSPHLPMFAPDRLGRYAAIYAGLGAVLFLVGMFVQVRLGELAVISRLMTLGRGLWSRLREKRA